MAALELKSGFRKKPAINFACKKEEEMRLLPHRQELPTAQSVRILS
jgi:hypothetical protein